MEGGNGEIFGEQSILFDMDNDYSVDVTSSSLTLLEIYSREFEMKYGKILDRLRTHFTQRYTLLNKLLLLRSLTENKNEMSFKSSIEKGEMNIFNKKGLSKFKNNNASKPMQRKIYQYY